MPGEGRLDLYDLRGRHVRRLAAARLDRDGAAIWDGRDDAGRPVAAGAYLAVLKHAGGVLRDRVVLAR
jgi:hypothetical protein